MFAPDEEEGSSSPSSSSGEEPEILIKTRSSTGPLPSEDGGLRYYCEQIEERVGLRIHEFGLRLATLVWFLVGVWSVMYCGIPEERQDLISATYLMVQLITTVGYGDIHPQSEGMRLFMGCLVFVGNVLTALVITERLQKMMHRSHDILKVNLVTNMVQESQKMRGAQSTSCVSHKQPNKWGGVVFAFVIYMCFLLIGAFYWGFVSTCLCPAGTLDCAYEQTCEEAGGINRNIVDGFYMGVITLTTVGFGDEAPTSSHGRLFGIFWMLFGVASMANFLAEMAHLVLVHNMQSVADYGISHDLFMKIDQDGSGTLTKFEFITYMLVRYGLVSEQDLDMLTEEFEGFDTDKDGELTYEEICPDSARHPGGVCNALACD